MVLEKKLLVSIERQGVAEVDEVAGVAKVTSHNFGCKRHWLAQAKSTGKNPGYCTIRRRAGGLEEKQE